MQRGCRVPGRHAPGVLDCLRPCLPTKMLHRYPTTAQTHALPLSSCYNCPTRLLCRTVVVCAPTGAGKTAIAEAATLHILAKGQRVIYTTPLKALSNQKLGEMRERFG